jgi:hypothetical protein
MILTRCYHVVIASAIASVLSTPAFAQDVASDNTGAPLPAPAWAPNPEIGKAVQDAAREKQDQAREAARARRATRSKAKDAEADRHTPKPGREEAQPDHIRGRITSVATSSIEVETANGEKLHLGLSDNLTVIKLIKGSFTTVDFGTYVGSAAVRLDEYSPIVRDSLSWLHKGFELRIVDNQLRGIALGHKKWDLTSDSIIAHGWVDDIEGRVLSIKWGPTEIEETDVEVARDVPVLKMALGDRSLIKRGAKILAGAHKGANGDYTTVFLFIGKGGVVPPL